MTSAEIITICYEAIRAVNHGVYRKIDFAEDMGIRPQHISNITSGSRGIGKSIAEKISLALSKHEIHVNPGHILDGLSQDNWKLIPEEAQPVGIPHLNGKHSEGEPIMIPHYQLSASAGGGALVEDTVRTQQIYFTTGWIRNDLHANPADLFAIDVEGDSMEPELRAGDTVLVDKTKVHLRKNGLYVLVIGDMLLVKRVEVLPDGSVLVKSDNPKYSAITIKPGEEEPFAVRGRVVWIIGRRPQ